MCGIALIDTEFIFGVSVFVLKQTLSSESIDSPLDSFSFPKVKHSMIL